MTTANNINLFPSHPAVLVKPALIGGGIALVAISLLLLSAGAHPEWGNFWMARPLFITPLAGAGGGMCCYLVSRLGERGTWKRIATTGIGVLGYVIALWMGTVLGCAGTLWN